MNSDQIRNQFNKVFHSQKNFMTPSIIEYGMINDKKLYELSCGKGICSHELIYGVTVIEDKGNGFDVCYSDKSKGGMNREEAYQFISQLKGETNNETII